MQRLDDWIRVYDEAVPRSFCESCIETFEVGATGSFDLEWRRCRELASVGGTPLFEPFKNHMRNVLSTYARETSSPALANMSAVEDPNIFRYDNTAVLLNRFHKHVDAWSVESASRQISVILYLNDVESGGETVFEDVHVEDPLCSRMTSWRAGRIVRPRVGRMLVFPSSYLFKHEGRAPVSGPKYVLVTWLHFALTPGSSGVKHAYRTYPLYRDAHAEVL